LSRRTEQQASSLEETASSMEEILRIVQNGQENVSETTALAKDSIQHARQGNESVQQTVLAMRNISESSNKIASIIGVIDEIAFQTNLLALNAAVEAARAGEQGRGFAVVASEVRNLAQRSADSAKEIKDLINDSVTRVDEGVSLVEQSGETLAQIVEAIDGVASKMDELAQSSKEQADGITQVNSAISQMDGITQQNAALVEEASASSQSMASEAERLSNLVSFFSNYKQA
jgi:methyl-accepting chemotaxis protein